MIDLKRNKLRNKTIFALCLFLLNGCATSFYKVRRETKNKTELLVTPDRIQMLCADMDTETEEKMFMFIMPVLDQSNEVVLVDQFTFYDQKYCLKRIKEIQKILAKGKAITIYGFGDLEKSKEGNTLTFHFPGHGTFRESGADLTFNAIANEKRDCWSVYHEGEKPCPRDEFPIKDDEI